MPTIPGTPEDSYGVSGLSTSPLGEVSPNTKLITGAIGDALKLGGDLLKGHLADKQNEKWNTFVDRTQAIVDHPDLNLIQKNEQLSRLRNAAAKEFGPKSLSQVDALIKDNYRKTEETEFGTVVKDANGIQIGFIPANENAAMEMDLAESIGTLQSAYPKSAESLQQFVDAVGFDAKKRAQLYTRNREIIEQQDAATNAIPLRIARGSREEIENFKKDYTQKTVGNLSRLEKNFMNDSVFHGIRTGSISPEAAAFAYRQQAMDFIDQQNDLFDKAKAYDEVTTRSKAMLDFYQNVQKSDVTQDQVLLDRYALLNKQYEERWKAQDPSGRITGPIEREQRYKEAQITAWGAQVAMDANALFQAAGRPQGVIQQTAIADQLMEAGRSMMSYNTPGGYADALAFGRGRMANIEKHVDILSRGGEVSRADIIELVKDVKAVSTDGALVATVNDEWSYLMLDKVIPFLQTHITDKQELRSLLAQLNQINTLAERTQEKYGWDDTKAEELRSTLPPSRTVSGRAPKGAWAQGFRNLMTNLFTDDAAEGKASAGRRTGSNPEEQPE